MNWFTIIVAVMRLINFAITRINISEGERRQIEKELAEMNVRLSKTRAIVKEKVSDEEVDADLRR